MGKLPLPAHRINATAISCTDNFKITTSTTTCNQNLVYLWYHAFGLLYIFWLALLASLSNLLSSTHFMLSCQESPWAPIIHALFVASSVYFKAVSYCKPNSLLFPVTHVYLLIQWYCNRTLESPTLMYWPRVLCLAELHWIGPVIIKLLTITWICRGAVEDLFAALWDGDEGCSMELLDERPALAWVKHDGSGDYAIHVACQMVRVAPIQSFCCLGFGGLL